MKVVFCASEAVPFSKTGGLADVTGALPLELAALGIEVVLIVPKYPSVRTSGVVTRMLNADFDMANVGANVHVYFLKHDMFLRSGLYGDHFGDYPDNLKRFSYFCQKAVSLLPKIKFIPDIVHGHDWQTSLLPLYLKDSRFGLGSAHKLPHTLLTIHNMAYQGVFAKAQLPETGLGWDYFSVMGLEFYDRINLLKGGILFSDFVNTVSATYAQEVQTPEHGCGLEGVLASKKGRFVGIPNGIDYRTWNPQTDVSIFKKYGVGNLRDKRVNKTALQETCGLTRDERIPLIGFVGRLVDQKGVEMILSGMSALATTGAQFIFLGQGEPSYEAALKETAAKYPGQVYFRSRFDDQLAHQIYAGSDIFLMPSRFEPCGIGQLISFKYGTVPVVYKTGGLADTVVDAEVDRKNASGFVFTRYESEAMVASVRRALLAYADPGHWAQLVDRVMRLNFSWKESARQYQMLYDRMIRKGA